MAKTTKNKAKDVETPVKQKNPLLKDMTGEQLAVALSSLWPQLTEIQANIAKINAELQRRESKSKEV